MSFGSVCDAFEAAHVTGLRPADDQREHRVMSDDELAAVLGAVDNRTRLYFRFVAETGARKSEALGRRHGESVPTQSRSPNSWPTTARWHP